jgi:hypothetical protein
MNITLTLAPAPSVRDPFSGSVTEYSIYTLSFDVPPDRAAMGRVGRALGRWPVGWEPTATGMRSLGPIKSEDEYDVREAVLGALPEPPPEPPPADLDDKDREWRDRRFR